MAPGLARTLAAGLSQDTTSGTSAAAASAAGWTRPGIGKTGTTNSSESVAFVGGTGGSPATRARPWSSPTGRTRRRSAPGRPVPPRRLRTRRLRRHGGRAAVLRRPEPAARRHARHSRARPRPGVPAAGAAPVHTLPGWSGGHRCTRLTRAAVAGQPPSPVLFRVAVLVKGLDGAIELIMAVVLLALPQQAVHRLVADVVTRDLLGPPDGALSRHFVAGTAEFASGNRTFVLLYLALHGVIKLALVVALLREWRAAYPVAIAVLGDLRGLRGLPGRADRLAAAAVPRGLRRRGDRAGVARVPHAAPRLGAMTVAPRIGVVPGGVRKVCQLTGERDRQRGTDAYNRTETRFGLVGTDLGASFEHAGRLWFLFGDTWPDAESGDSVAWTTDRTPEPGIRLHFASSGGRFACPRVSRADGSRVSTRAFEVPTAGFSANGHMYVIRTTEHYREAGREVMGRSVLTRAVNGDPTDLACLYDLSVVRSGGTFVNVSCVVVEGGLRRAAVPRAGPDRVGERTLPGERRVPGRRPARVRRGRGCLAVPLRHRPLGAAGLERARARRPSAVPASADRRALGHLERAAGPVADAVQRRLPAGRRRPRRAPPLGILVRPRGRPRSRRPGLGYGAFMHVKDAPDGLSDPGREHEWGGEYGPYVIDRYTRALPGGRAAVYFVLSTWNPYNVVEMRAVLEGG